MGNGQLEVGVGTSKNQSKICNSTAGVFRVFYLLRFRSVSHFYATNVKIYRDQFSKTAALFRYVKKRGPITTTLPGVTGGDRNWE